MIKVAFNIGFGIEPYPYLVISNEKRRKVQTEQTEIQNKYRGTTYIFYGLFKFC